MNAYITSISFYVPDKVVTNQDLQSENPDWDVAQIENKTGIKMRHIANEDECASDLGYVAASRLLDATGINKDTIECLIFCTQSPDFFLPASACLLQNRLGLSIDCAAFDINQGCSGYVYGLYVAKGLVVAGLAKTVLLITADTYSKFIHPRDRTTRVLFGDGASATLITTEPSGAELGAFVMGTDGSGSQSLIVPAGACRSRISDKTKQEFTDENGCTRSPENLYMDGQELFAFALQRVPKLVKATLASAGLEKDDVDWFIFHQANAFMNEHLRARIGVPKNRAPLCMESYGNTVSSSIPITLWHSAKQFSPGQKVMLVGFGVGYSWGACMLEWGDVVLA